jgi:hypothetical protein
LSSFSINQSRRHVLQNHNRAFCRSSSLGVPVQLPDTIHISLRSVEAGLRCAWNGRISVSPGDLSTVQVEVGRGVLRFGRQGLNEHWVACAGTGIDGEIDVSRVGRGAAVVGVLFVGYDLAIGGGVSDYDFWLTMPTHQSRWLFRLTSCVGSARDGGLGDIAEVGSAISNEEWQTGDVVAVSPKLAEGSVNSTPAKWLCLGEAKQTDSESDGWLEELHVGCSERVMRSVEKVCG